MKLKFLLAATAMLAPNYDGGGGEFENYDDENSNYDDETADSYTGKPGGIIRPKRRASFDLTMKNVSAEDITIEMFNRDNTFTEHQRLDILNGLTATLIPMLSAEGLAAARVGCVGFDKKGQLLITGTAAAVMVTVDCPQYTYKGLLSSSGRTPFNLVAVRMTTTTDGQIDNEIVHFTNTFLGAKTQNTINPRTSFRPEQFQAKIIDIPMNFRIDNQKGITYKINAGETVKWNCIIERN